MITGLLSRKLFHAGIKTGVQDVPEWYRYQLLVRRMYRKGAGLFMTSELACQFLLFESFIIL
jgi:hypothetical protein